MSKAIESTVRDAATRISRQDGPSTWAETLVGMGSFLLVSIGFVLASVLATLHANAILSVLVLTIIGAIVIVSGLGWVRGFPRWSFPYWGMALALSGLFFDQWGWIPVVLMAVVTSLLARRGGLARGVRPLRQLVTGVWHDWTRLSFAFYGTLPLALAIAFGEVEGQGPVVVLSVALALGALAYMRSTRMWQRALALFGGFSLMWPAATVYLAHYWDGRREQWMPRPGDWSRTIQMTNRGVGLLVLLLAPALLGLLHLVIRFIRPWWVAYKGRIASRTLIRLVLVAGALAVLAGVVILRNRQLEEPRYDTVSPLHLDNATDVVQVLSWGEVQQERLAPADTMFATTGRQLYVIGDVDGGFRPRSNPYDLAAFGEPRADDPLANELQGVWAQPVKALDSYLFEVEVDGERWPLLDAHRFTQTFADVQFDFQRGPLKATRRDFVPQDRPALFTTLTLQNAGDEPVDVRLTFFAYFDLEDAWLTSLADKRNTSETVQVDGEYLIAQAESAPDAWAVAVGGENPPEQAQVTNGPDGQHVGQMEYTARLAPGAPLSWTFAIVVETESGPETALQHLDEWLPQGETLLAEKQTLYDTLLTAGPRFHSPDADFDAAFDIARANGQMLEAESLALGRYFYAGLETFPYWFSNDLAYGASGLTLAGFGPTVAAHLRTGATQAVEYGGQVPHQLSPAGSLIAVGNVQETPQFVSAAWDYYCWTGDSAFLADVYPIAVEGVFEYNLDRADQDDDSYPEGAGMVERTGMGPEKLDAACYLWDALVDLAQMAEVLGDADTADRAQSAANALQASFDADWWLPEEEVYANSLLRYKNKPRHDGHWTVAVPLEVGIAPTEHARLSLARIQRGYLNEWGLVHTRGDDERVWTLPTATLSRGAYRYSDPEMGLEMLQHLAQTLDHGSIGTFHELIPEGFSFLQSWSGATFVRGAVEDLMGITVRADLHTVTIAPQLTAAWDFAELENVRFGEYTITVRATHTGVTVTHTSGPATLFVTYRAPDGTETAFTLEAGETFAANE